MGGQDAPLPSARAAQAHPLAAFCKATKLISVLSPRDKVETQLDRETSGRDDHLGQRGCLALSAHLPDTQQ